MIDAQPSRSREAKTHCSHCGGTDFQRGLIDNVMFVPTDEDGARPSFWNELRNQSSLTGAACKDCWTVRILLAGSGG